MNSKLLTLIPLLANTIFFAQNFAGKDVDLYLNMTVKPKEIPEKLQQYAYQNFFIEFDTVTGTLTTEPIGKKKRDFKPFQLGDYTFTSDYSKLVGMEFKVTGVYEETPKFDFDKGKFFVFALTNESLGTIYYKYDSRYEHNLELIVIGGVNFPEGYWCEKITVVKDKFEDKTSFYSPQESGFSLVKVVKGSEINYFLKVDEDGETANVDGKGLYLLFDDGTKMSKDDAKIEVNIVKKEALFIQLLFN